MLLFFGAILKKCYEKIEKIRTESVVLEGNYERRPKTI